MALFDVLRTDLNFMQIRKSCATFYQCILYVNIYYWCPMLLTRCFVAPFGVIHK